MEKIDHLDAGCPILAAKEYKERCDKMGQCSRHWRIYHQYNASKAEHRYERHPEPFSESNDAFILWDFIILTDKSIKANWSDIIVKAPLPNAGIH